MIEDLRTVLSKITKFDLKTTLSAWGRIPVHKIDFRTVKYDIIQQILELAIKLHVTQDDAFQLDLLYLTEHPSKKIWKAFHLTEPISESSDTSLFHPSRFQKSLLQRLYVTHSCNVQVRQHQYALWGRVSQAGYSRVVYFIYFPESCHFLLSKAANTRALAETIIKALRKVLQYKQCEGMELESNSPNSLAQILLHRSSETEYDYDEGFYKPSERCEPKELRGFCDDRVQIEHMKQLKREKEIIDRQYGKELQPQLQSLTINASTRFRGNRYLPNVPPSTVINCRTKIVGSNVLEGLRNAALGNLCNLPLPSFLTEAAKTGIQCIKITDKPTDENSPP